MTTSVTIRPAGHHVRVTTVQAPATQVDPAEQFEPIETAHDLAPGDAERTFYIHSEMSIRVEEFVPAAQEA